MHSESLSKLSAITSDTLNKWASSPDLLIFVQFFLNTFHKIGNAILNNFHFYIRKDFKFDLHCFLVQKHINQENILTF